MFYFKDQVSHIIPTGCHTTGYVRIRRASAVLLGSRYVQERPAQNFVQDVCGQFQLCTSPQTNPTLTLTNPLWGGSRSTGAVRWLRRMFWWRFRQKTPGGRKTSLDQQDPHSAQSCVQTAPALCTKLCADRSCT